jgi:hypothetical protein
VTKEKREMESVLMTDSLLPRRAFERAWRNQWTAAVVPSQ